MNLTDRYLDLVICLNSYDCIGDNWLTITIDAADMYLRVLSTDLYSFINLMSSTIIMERFI